MDTTVTTDANGRFNTTLQVTSFAAGDNYRIEASTIPSFGQKSGCDESNNCYRSGVITAWKRVFLEVGRMFKRGAFVKTLIPPGSKAVVVADGTPFKSGDTVVFLHGPTERIGPSSPATEYHTEQRSIDAVASTDGGASIITLDQPLQFSLVGTGEEPGGYPSLRDDFVGVVTGNAQNDYYEVNLGYLNDLYRDSFVDYVVLPAVPLPLVNRLVDGLNIAPTEEAHFFAKRWYRHYDRNNHQFVFGCREASTVLPPVQARGMTRAIEGFSYSYMMVKPLLGATGSANSHRLLGELTAHEVSHQWHVDRWSSHTANGEHCGDFTYYDNPEKVCLMHYTSGPVGNALPEFYDDVVHFHYIDHGTGADSEYRWIRERCDPIPAFGAGAAQDWWLIPATPCR